MYYIKKYKKLNYIKNMRKKKSDFCVVRKVVELNKDK